MWARCKSCGKYGQMEKTMCWQCAHIYNYNKREKEISKAVEKERKENPTIEPRDPFLEKTDEEKYWDNFIDNL